MKKEAHPRSPYFEEYLLTLTLEKVAAIRELLRDKAKYIIKIKKIGKIIGIRFYTLHKADRIIGVFQCLEHFYEIEKKMVTKYSNEELLAGIKELPSDENSLAITVGKMFMIDPDIILTKWQYIKVLGILMNGYEENEYRKRLQIVYNSKQKIK